MTDAETKKAEISSLWGISTEQIDEKLNTLKAIISDSSDYSLLELLLRSDLNIETAIGRHFGGNTLSPQPLSSSIASEGAECLSPPVQSSNHNQHSQPIFDDENTTSIPPSSRICSIEDIHFDSEREGSVDPPPRKKRRLNRSEINAINKSSHSNTHNTNNSNSSNNTNSNLSSRSELIFNDNHSNPITNNHVITVDRDWKEKKMGRIRLKYDDLYRRLRSSRRRTKVSSIKRLSDAVRSGRIKVVSSSPHFGQNTKTKRTLYHAVIHYQQRKEVMEDWDPESALRRPIGVVLKMNRKKRKCIDREKRRYKRDIEVTFHRKHRKTTQFTVESPLCVAAFSQSATLKAETLKCHRILSEYKKKGHSFYLPSLLDFSCRYSHDLNDRSDNYNHGLNLTLYPYQLQSLQWMIEEENHPNGFYRHLYYEGRFGDDTPFVFSPVFNFIEFNGTIPVAHSGLLCEEMGLGKTIISLALIHAQNKRDLSGYSTKRELVITDKGRVSKSRYDTSNPQQPRLWYKSAATLIIAPTSLVGQWESECDERSEGRLKWRRYYGGNRSRRVKDYIEYDIVFTTYGIMGVETGTDRKKHVLHQIEWNRIILDESHSIKNAQNVQSKSIAALKGRNRWCLTGTPFGTKVTDIENQLRFIGMRSDDIENLDLDVLFRDKAFNDSYHDKDYKAGMIKKYAKPLVSLIGRIVMRHKKDQEFNGEAIVSMVDKEENEIFIEFNSSQRVYYDKLFNAAKERYGFYSSINSVPRASLQILSSLFPARSACSGFVCSKDEIEEKLSDAEAQSFHIRTMVQQVADRNLSSKELFEMAAEEAFADRDGECPICFECPLDDPLQTPCRHLFCGECIMDVLRQKPECPMCRRATNPKDLKKPTGESKEDDVVEGETVKKENGNVQGDDDVIRFDSKIKRLMAELKKIKRNRPNEKSLIFTSFSKSLDWICSELERNGFSYRTLTGNMTMNKRKKQLDQFANDDDVKVFVLTVRAGAVGITLTAANHVFVMEPTLNPALHRQAINRVYRLGQRRKVTIHTMIMRDSIEERIWNVIHKDNGRNDKGENVDDEELISSQETVNAPQHGRNDKIAGNINDDRRARLESSIIAKLFQ